ncbi:cbb3-type cytochrome c oxidase subunit I [Falsirhodobacter algicola]|uniref:Cytochrome oxidase subunit I profile domain-containing protein n=1 Tax=Falsirhodobacter algicola TaxID=2692330 RepID=A0A8J8MRG0_9RHOB|nr:cbb3-type cytochrome c oxidase subunit I [Falsirhodobacter algicola]QUS34928.1 hypothetical protein GR316_00755 [Falsirhodobacter algicola]
MAADDMTPKAAPDHRLIGLAHLLIALIAGAGASGLAAALRFGWIEGSAGAIAAHGVLMTFFVTLPALFGGIAALALPAEIGARGPALPRMAHLALWLHALGVAGAGAAVLTASLPVGLGALAMVGLSGSLSAINVITTFVVARRRPAAEVPVLGWSLLITACVLLAALPVVSAAAVLLAAGIGRPAALWLDAGGDVAALRGVLWFYGQPELFAMLLPGFGIIAHVTERATGRALPARTAFVGLLAIVAALGTILWMQQSFAGTLPMDGFLALAPRLAALPALMLAGLVLMVLRGAALGLPMAWGMAALALMATGAVTTLLGGTEPARFHYVVALASAFALFAAFYLWLPEITGRALPARSAWVQFGLIALGTVLGWAPGAFGSNGTVPAQIGTGLSVAGLALFLVSAGLALRPLLARGWALRRA